MKALKIILITLGSILAIGYLGFLFVVPNLIDLDKFVPEITKQVEAAVKFKLNLKGIKLKTAWNLSAGALIEKADLATPDGNKIAQINDLEIKLSLIPILFKTVKIDSIDIEKVIVRLDVDKSGKFAIEKFIPQPSQDASPAPEMPIKFSDNMPSVKIKEYKIAFIEGAKTYAIKGENFKITDFVLNKKIKVSTEGALVLDGREQIKYDMEIFNKFFPEAQPKQAPTQPVAFNIVEVFNNLYKYNVKANIDADLKIDKDMKIDGDLALDKILFTLQGKTLPPSDLDLKFSGEKIKINSDFYTDINEKATISGYFNNSKRQTIDLNVKSDKTDLKNTFLIADTLLQLVGIKDLKGVSANGHLIADFNLKSDFKKVNSSGYLKIDNANVAYPLYKVVLSAINADIDFSNNKINIKKSSANLNGSPIIVKGSIDHNAFADLVVSANNLPVKGLLATLGQAQILKENNVISGLLSLNASLKGRLEKATPQVDIVLASLNVKNIPNKAQIILPVAKVKVTTNGQKVNGKVALDGLKIISQMPTLTVPKAAVSFDEKDLKIDSAQVILNNSKIDVFGDVKDYSNKRMNIAITARGLMFAADIKNLLPKELRSGVGAVGKIPLLVKISGNDKAQSIEAQMLANSTNHLSVLDINSLAGKTSLINLSASMAGDSLKLNDATLYVLGANKGLSDNLKANLSSGTKVITVGGKVNNLSAKVPTLNGIAVNIPSQISTSIPGFDGSNVSLKGSIGVNGRVDNPTLSGGLNIPSAIIPTMKVNLKNLGVKFNKNSIDAGCPQFAIANSSMGFNANVDNNFAKGILIRNVDFTGQMLDLDTLAQAFAAMPQNTNAPGTDLGVTVLQGKGNVAKFKMGGLAASNISTNFDLKKNVLKLHNLNATAYLGKVAGDISYDLVYGRIGLNLQGRGLSAEPAIRGLSGLPEAPNGILDFDSNLAMVGYTDKDLMGSMKGNANFIISNGQMGKLGQLEHLLYAQNILSNNVFKTTLGVVAKTLTVKNTGSFKYIKGKMTFANGWANIQSIQTSGPTMSMYVSGKLNLLNNSANMVILGRLSNDVVQLLGPIGDFSMDKLLSSIPKVGAITASLVNQMTSNPDSENLSMLPDLSPKTTLPTKEFKVVFNGGLESQSSVKSFKWLSQPEVAQTVIPTNPYVPSQIPMNKEQLKQTVNDSAQKAIQQYIPPSVQNFQKKAAPVADFINSLPDMR